MASVVVAVATNHVKLFFQGRYGQGRGLQDQRKTAFLYGPR